MSTVQNAQTVVQATDQSLMQFLQTIWFTREFEIFYAVAIGAIIGMFANYFVRWLKSDEAGSAIDYFFRNHPKATLLAALSVLAEVIGEAASGIFFTDTGIFVGWGLTIMSGVKSGWLIDAALNKGTRAVQPEKHDTVMPVNTGHDG